MSMRRAAWRFFVLCFGFAAYLTAVFLWYPHQSLPESWVETFTPAAWLYTGLWLGARASDRKRQPDTPDPDSDQMP